jgi:hypothetical protein
MVRYSQYPFILSPIFPINQSITSKYSDLFHPDNIKNVVEGTKVGQSLSNLWHKFGGAAGLSTGLHSNLKVPHINLIYTLYRVESKEIVLILREENRSIIE